MKARVTIEYDPPEGDRTALRDRATVDDQRDGTELAVCDGQS
jgi:hypothetical protein